MSIPLAIGNAKQLGKENPVPLPTGIGGKPAKRQVRISHGRSVYKLTNYLPHRPTYYKKCPGQCVNTARADTERYKLAMSNPNLQPNGVGVNRPAGDFDASPTACADRVRKLQALTQAEYHHLLVIIQAILPRQYCEARDASNEGLMSDTWLRRAPYAVAIRTRLLRHRCLTAPAAPLRDVTLNC